MKRIFAAAWPGILAIALIIWRWERFTDGLGGGETDRLVASVFLIATIAASAIAAARRARVPAIERESRRRSPRDLAMRRFRANRLAVWSIRVILLTCAAAVLAPILAPYDPAAIGDVMASRYLPPSWEHPFGTDPNQLHLTGLCHVIDDTVAEILEVKPLAHSA